jgi:hypothetical protein
MPGTDIRKSKSKDLELITKASDPVSFNLFRCSICCCLNFSLRRVRRQSCSHAVCVKTLAASGIRAVLFHTEHTALHENIVFCSALITNVEGINNVLCISSMHA